MLQTLRSTQLPFVAFVGAGASGIPPSRLPGWIEFNQLLLETLCVKLDDYSSRRQPTARMLEVFGSLRDDARLLAPDFQAQLIEEEVGADYFAVWQSLETWVYGPVHAALAELASHGRLAAIVTTNFDRLIEIALKERGVPHDVFHDAAGFERLSGVIDRPAPVLPVVKIHGSIEDASSLVDTLRQRVVGRPPALEASLARLLRLAPWLFLGFSGRDFNYNRHYLGVLDAAQDAKGFVFVNAPGRDLQPGVVNLIDAYQHVEATKADAVDGDLTTWLADTFGLPMWTSSNQASAESQAQVSAHVKQKIQGWVDTLGPVSVVNIICSMLKSSSLEHEAWWLLRKTFKSYRTPDDTKTRSYQRYNYNYGTLLLDSGLIRNPVALAEDKSNLSEWKTYADQNAFEFLARGYKEGGILASGGALGAVMAYRGEVGRAIGLLGEVTRQAFRTEAWLDLCDIAIWSVVLYDIVQYFTAGAGQLEQCLEKATMLGDEPRRAMLCAHLGRLLTYTREFQRADMMLKEADRVAGQIGLRKVALTTRAARGIWFLDSGTSAQQAVQALESLAQDINQSDDEPLVTHVDIGDPNLTQTTIRGRQPILCRVLLDLTAAALAMRDGDTIKRSLSQLDELTTNHFNGYLPHYYFVWARCLMLSDPPSPKQALGLVRKAKEIGVESQNPWVAQYGTMLEQRILADSPPAGG